MEIKYKLEVQVDDSPVRGNAMCSGDEELDKKVEDEIIARLDDGDVWAWALVKVTAYVEGCSVVGVDYLGACCYSDEEEFEGDAYHEDMKEEAKSDLLSEMKRVAECYRQLEKEKHDDVQD